MAIKKQTLWKESVELKKVVKESKKASKDKKEVKKKEEKKKLVKKSSKKSLPEKKVEKKKKKEGVVKKGKNSDLEKDKDKKKWKDKLNPEQEFFCQLYATCRTTFWNWVQSYIEAYDINTTEKWAYASARTCAYRLLTNVDILNRINELLELWPLNNTNVDRQLWFLIDQFADLSTKLWAIREYNKLKSRVNDKLTVEHVWLWEALLKLKERRNAGK